MKTLSRSDLIALASRLVTEAGGQTAAATRVGITQSAISQALAVDPSSSRYDGTLIRIVEGLSGRTVETRWRVVR